MSRERKKEIEDGEVYLDFQRRIKSIKTNFRSDIVCQSPIDYSIELPF